MDRELVNEVSEVIDLVKQARSYGGCSEATHEVSELVHGLADRIEQLERELSEARGLERDTYAANKAAFVDLQAELAAEKALADDLYEFAFKRAAPDSLPLIAYRKARGL